MCCGIKVSKKSSENTPHWGIVILRYDIGMASGFFGLNFGVPFLFSASAINLLFFTIFSL